MPFREAYNMLVSHSPPVFSHSPPTGYLHQQRGGATYEPFGTRVLSGTCRNQSSLTHHHHNTAKSSNPITIPRRGCLVVRTNDDEDVVMVAETRRDKKRVVFADDRGMALTQIRVMTEPSNVPPVWSLRFLAQVTQGMSAEPTVVHEPWEVTFSQPAAEYLEFRKRLDTLKVSLENVIVKDVEQAIVGTIKVCNIAFDKHVLIRYSMDSWKTYKDQDCIFVGNISSVNNGTSTTMKNPHSLYDTFSFRLEMAVDSRNVEFCVCFRCQDFEFWDNNATRNYSVVKKVVRAKYGKMAPAKVAFGSQLVGVINGEDRANLNRKCADIFQAKMESWGEFASWTQLENNHPYW